MLASRPTRRDRAPRPDAIAPATASEFSGAPVRNRLLLTLTPRALESLAEDIDVIDLSAGTVVHEPHALIEYVYFPETAVASMVRRMRDGSGVEVGTIGFEGISGICVGMLVAPSTTQCVTQVAGTASRMPTESLLRAASSKSIKTRTGASFGSVLDLYAQSLFEIVAQSAACNRLHSLEQRCARWLLMTHDRVIGDELVLTQEFLSYMLGVRRAGVTEAAGSLQRSGLISYRHGRITVKDRQGLESACCECYGVGVAAYAMLLPTV